MAEPVRDRRLRLAAWALCLIAGAILGVSGFNAESNHPTYLPPGIAYVDPSFLAGDWWLHSSRHYHYAFFVLTAALAWLGALEAGLALLNVATVAGGLYACFRMMIWLGAERPLACLALFASLFVATATFFSVGDSYLFTPSLQPASVAAAATLAALLCFLEGRLVRTGLWLVLAGLFHVNFLMANIAFFGLAYVLRAVQEAPLRSLLGRRSVVALLRLLGPSLLLSALFVPLVLAVQDEALTASATVAADWIFFRFAVPYHYYPLDYPGRFVVFLWWQVLGALWTTRAVPDPAQRRAAWAVQLALGLIIWSASALTTLVFVAPVSRLFLWRLAPFAVLFSALLITVGALRLLAAGGPPKAPTRLDRIAVLAGFASLPILALPIVALVGQPLSTKGHSPGAIVLALVLVLVALRLWAGLVLPGNRPVAAAALAALLAFAAATQPEYGGRSRHSLLLGSPEARHEDALFAFVRGSTPADAQFLIPPSLAFFRLQGQRAAVVDFKAMPINRASLIEWYRRLADISGERRPADMGAVNRGYRTLDAARLERLRREYRLTHVVLGRGQTLAPAGWIEVFRNPAYRVLAYRLGLRPAASP